MIKLYTQFGELIVCNKAEFLGMVPHETVGPKVDLPYITGLNEEIGSFNMINKKLDINSNLQFFSNKHFPKKRMMDVVMELGTNYMFPETLHCVIVGKNFYLYSDPVVYEFAGKYQVISKKYQDVYSCSIEHSGIMDKIQRFKATRLAKRMFPDVLEVDGWLYSC